MKIVCALLIVAVACSANAGRIVGGEPTTIGQYPSLVQVEFRNLIFWGQSCAANILTSRYVLSAAHCFAGLFFNTDDRRIRAGSSNRGSGGVIVGIRSRLNHPNYRHIISVDFDISLVELESALTFTDYIQTIAIPPQNFELPDNLDVVHAGWGLTSEDGLSSAILRDVTVKTINRQICRERYSKREPIPISITDNMLCAGILDVGGKDACQGDSGGPLYFDNILVGIVSFGEGCARADFPGVSARIAAFTNWIIENAV